MLESRSTSGSRRLVLGSGKLVSEKGLVQLSESDPSNFRRLAVLVNYQSFIQDRRFPDVVSQLRQEFRDKNTATGTYHEAPYRSTVLGRLRQLKAEQFLQLWDAISAVRKFDFFEHMRNVDPMNLLYQDQKSGIVAVYGSVVKLGSPQMSELVSGCNEGVKLPFTIPLPTLLHARYEAGNGLDPEDLPF